MENLTVELTSKVGKDGKMFGAISTKQIVEEYKKQFDIELDKRKIVDSKSVSNLGYTKLKIELYKNVIATITVHVKEDK
jgi:large subunit ribosomal protein L9